MNLVAQKTVTIALVGNPNCGKTTILNQLAHAHEAVGILVVAALVRHFRRSFGGGPGGCGGGCSCGAGKPDRERCG